MLGLPPRDEKLDSDVPRTLGEAQMSLRRLDTLHPGFESEFSKYRSGFLNVLAQSYDCYYGDAYHMKRILDGRSILYFVLMRDEVVAVSYVKRNLRRGGTAVFPKEYRRLGLAEALIRASWADFPEQYSILGVSHTHMIRLLLKMGFFRATSIEQLRAVTKDEFQHLSDLGVSDDGVVFKRHSKKRDSDRETLTILYRNPHANTR